MKKKKFNWKQSLGMTLFGVFGLGCGYAMASLAETVGDGSFTGLLFTIVLGIVAFILQLVIHEAGHLVFGLLSGYTFSSFRIGGLAIIKGENGLEWKLKSIAGTGGQCLLGPPEIKNGTYPYRLYHMGGAIMNLATSIVFGALYVSFPNMGLFSIFLAALALFGLLTAATNGLPMRTQMLDNDGMNALNLGKDQDALMAMWYQLKINDLLTSGKRLQDLPEKWFQISPTANKHNPIISTITVFAENRAMEMHNFTEARHLQQVLLTDEYTIVGLYEQLLKLDIIYLNILEKGKDADVHYLEDKVLQKFNSSMANYPSVIRTQYALAKGYFEDEAQATKVKAHFEKIAPSFPDKNDIITERGLMDLIDQKK